MMELKRQHIFKDILKGSAGTYHSAILTCYSFDPFFYSHFYKSQLNVRGIGNQIVLVDAGSLDKAKENEQMSALPGDSAFTGYTPLRVDCRNGGVFHPKIGLFIGQKRLTAVIGSGNLTYSGMSFNDEAWCAFSIDSPEAADAPVIAHVWRYLKAFVQQQGLSCAELQLSWMLENSDLLQQVNKWEGGSLTQADSLGQRFEFIANSPNSSIFDHIRKAVGQAHVKTIRICAPFYDMKGTALKSFLRTFSPEKIECLVHPDEGALPLALNLEENPSIRFYRFNVEDKSESSAEKKERHFVHAKLIQLETSEGTILAVGSANASIQALGNETLGASNDEADIIIRSSRKRDYLAELKISPLSEIADFSSVKVTEKNADQKPVQREMVLRSCELLDDGYHLQLSKGSVNSVALHLVNDYGKEVIQHYDHLEAGALVIQPEDHFIARTVFLTRDGKQISNRCLIIRHAEVEGKNPDRMLAPISQLLETASSIQDFTSLLRYVQIEEETLPHVGVHAGSGGAARKERTDAPRIITDEDLEHKVYKNRLAFSEMVNERILERVAHLFITSTEGVDYDEKPEDEPNDQKAKDSGLTVQNSKSSRPQKEPLLIDEARGYFKKLLGFYDKLSWENDIFKNERGQQDLTTCLKRKPAYIHHCSDLALSRVCIAVFEMCKIARHGTFAEWREMMGYFVSIVGAHLLIYRDTPEGVSEAVGKKIALKHHNLVVFSLLLIAFWEEYSPRAILLRLLTLNLFDSYRDNLPELEKAYQDFQSLLEKGLLPTKRKSLKMIDACYRDYLSFVHAAQKPKDVLSPYLKTALIYKTHFGFIQLESIQYTQKVKSIVKGPVKFIECTAIAPGFPKSIHFRNRYIRGMIPGTSLQASSTVIEQA